MRSARRFMTVAAVGFLFTVGACQDQGAPTAPEVAPRAASELLGTTTSDSDAPQGTRIEVRAAAGDLVGYHFSPHGLQFRLPVTLTQDLEKTDVTRSLLDKLVGAYFDG
jgi:hypothetical protein